ncbi:piggyBac transposable element-derived protein 4-like [Acanthopagrus latus]|uniref:piggyBac transposable element-derived protein 4-like n=1 Tax=Acanthopagrus latus TaxID=8177 RepID=UPI00187CB387|nr:piggyBac transposable element-derived protein 4-like [Acanthopagrus latus]
MAARHTPRHTYIHLPKEVFFELFLTDSIKNIVVNMTNLEGKRVYKDNWKEVTQTDMNAYMGVLILAGVYRSRNESTSSLWDAESGRTIFRATMSLQKFHMLSRVIRFDNRDTRPGRRQQDKLAAIREVWDKWVERLPLIYNPSPNFTVDERLVAFRGRCPFKQYMPSKPSKYGIKIWATCDASTSYAWKMQVYTGKSADGVPEKNQGKRVVLEMTAGLKGHNITCDNFFTSDTLGQELLQKKLTMVGTIRRNKPELPPALLATQDRDRFSSRFAFTDTHTLVSYCPKKRKNVLLMTTLHRDAAVSTREDKKPNAILDYNRNKGGVDNLDKVTGTYSCQRKTARWPMVVFFNMLDVSAYNAFVLWMEVNPRWKQGKCFKRRLFLEELGKAMLAPSIQQHQHLPRTPASAGLVREIQGGEARSPAARERGDKRKRCSLCAPRDVKTSMTCQKCNAYVCKAHATTCTYCPKCA